MARSNPKPTPVRGSLPPKAGKKHLFTEPSPPNPEKENARKAGSQQFISPTALSVPGTKIVFDKNVQQFVTKVVAINVPFLYDETRKQFIYSPVKPEKGER